MNFKTNIAKKISNLIDLDISKIEELIEIPKRQEQGDYAFPVFILAKEFKKAPPIIAIELSEKIDHSGFEKIEANGPYLNFFLDKGFVSESIIEEVLNNPSTYGSSNTGKGKNVVIDYSSPNIAKPFHVGHMFTTIVGNSIYKTYTYEGYNVTRINYLGDWGTQYGRLIAAYDRWVDKDNLENNTIKELERIYVKFYKEAEIDPTLNDVARQHFRNLENGEEKETALWKKFRELSLKEFQVVYDMLGVEFDSYNGESYYSDKMDAVIKELEEKNLLKDSNGAKIVDLEEYSMPPCLILKSDGSTIYATRDIAAVLDRKKTFNFDKSIYVVGIPQSLHFKQLFKVIELLGYDFADSLVHVGFGLVKFKDRKLSSRGGDVIYLEELLKESISKSKNIIEERNPALLNKDDVSKKIGIGAIVFTYLKNNREKDIIFDWNEMLSFEGETGPYVQYSYARAKSILRKSSSDNAPDYSKLNSNEEYTLVKQIGMFNSVIESAIKKYEPSIITRYVIDLAQDFNSFYNAININKTEDESTKSARLSLVKATAITLKLGLSLIGIETIEEM